MNEKAKGIPHSKESEMMVLGCMLTSEAGLIAAADLLDDQDFFFPEHKSIFSILKNFYKKDRPADLHLVSEELKRMGELEAIGGIPYLTALAQYAGTAAYVEEYADIVKSKALLRKMIQAAEWVEKKARGEPEDVREALDEAQALFYNINQSTAKNPGLLIHELISGVKASSKLPYLKELQDRQEKYLKHGGKDDPAVTGIPSYFLELDRLINGLNNSHLIILASRPAMGKTALALNIAENVCFKNNFPVGIFSLEMTAEQLLHRMITSQSEVEAEKIRTGKLSGVEFQRIVASVSEMQKHNLVIDDQPGLKITDLRARARRLKEAYGVRLLVIDYLQLISGSGLTRNFENRQNEISEISRMLKTLARELDIPIICLAQLSRKVEDRAGHRPMMSDLRESGCLTGDTLIQDAKTGKFYTIKELASRPRQTTVYVHAVDSQYKIGTYKMVKAFYSGKKIVYELKLKSGRSIKASSNHKFLKLDGWTPLDQMKKGDKIAIPRKLNIAGRKDFNSDEVSLLAHLLGDGCILPKQPYHYTSADEENIRIVEKAARDLFNITPKRVKQKNWHHVYFPSPYRLTKGKYHPITLWFQKLGISRSRSYEKEIPESIFKLDENGISLFLMHLWGTDGNISIKKLKNRKDSANIYYSTSSEKLGNQVQRLLLRIGIQSTIKAVPSKKGYRSMYHISIQGKENQLCFLEKVNSSGSRGELKQILLKNLSLIETNPNNDVIPKEAWKKFVTPAKNKKNLSWRQLSSQLKISYSGSFLKNGISRNKMRVLNEHLQDPSLQNLANSDVYWDEIVGITELGLEDVYDATVDDVHNFIANDIIVHNSLEQDADIVLFLLRREYYDPNDKPGMAEIIVAKNRHGATGSVNLTFIKDLAQFRNYSAYASEVDSFATL